MQIEHYNAIAKIVGGVLDNNERLNAMVKTLTNYFESVDENFNSGEFRSACLNGHQMEETPEIDTNPTKTEISPKTVQNKADNWNPVSKTPVREDIHGFKDACKRMTDIIVKTHGNTKIVKWGITIKRVS